ncbi:hypothetical protein N0V82_003843 [Gnomoniopsis sp. IMI 355080]|nr:hypothetical protein N0V82_003843 [Gnomoniopsis sp. IMI 355080]
MANQYFTRTYSDSSAGKLESGKASRSGRYSKSPFSRDQLLTEFQKHADLWQQDPTGLVSVSDRIIDTLQRAFQRYYEYGEDPASIWIVLIEKESVGERSPHSASELARECGMEDPGKYSHEFIFEWKIPSEAVAHIVPLEFLIDHGLDMQEFLVKGPTQRPKLPTTKDLRNAMANSYEAGLDLWSFAWSKPAAPKWLIAHQIIADCTNGYLNVLTEGWLLAEEIKVWELMDAQEEEDDMLEEMWIWAWMDEQEEEDDILEEMWIWELMDQQEEEDDMLEEMWI